MALTSGDNLHIIGAAGRRVIYCEPMAANVKVGRFDRTAALDTVRRT
jgi:hypothetical protein